MGLKRSEQVRSVGILSFFGGYCGYLVKEYKVDLIKGIYCGLELRGKWEGV